MTCTCATRNSRPRTIPQGRQRRAGSSGGTVSVTISIGVAERQVEHRNPEEVLKSADQALYSAKGAGRNCVMVSWATIAARCGARRESKTRSVW